MPHTVSVGQRLMGGGGFGGGFARGITQNILQNRQDDRLVAQLMGDIAGMEGELPPGMQSQIPTGESQGGLGNLLSVLGIGGRRGPSVEDLIMQRTKMQRQVQMYRQRLEESRRVVDTIMRTKPELADDAIKQIGERLTPLEREMFLTVVVPDIKKKNALEKQKLAATERFRLGMGGRPTIETEAGDVPIGNIKPSREEAASLLAQIPGMEKEAVQFLPQDRPPTRPFGSAQSGYFQQGQGGEVTQIVPPAAPKVETVQSDDYVTAARSLGLDPAQSATWTPDQWKSVRDKIQQDRIGVAGATAAAQTGARIAEKRAGPIPTTELANLVDPDFKPFQLGTTFEQAEAAGAIFASPKLRQTISDLESTQTLVDELKGLADRVITAQSAGEAALQGAVKGVGGITRLSPTASAYQDKKASFTGVISRNLGGEKGVLTDRDVDRVVRALPSLRDTKAIKDFKLASVQLILDTAFEAKKDIATGKTFDRIVYRQKLEQLLDRLEGKSGAKKERTIDLNR